MKYFNLYMIAAFALATVTFAAPGFRHYVHLSDPDADDATFTLPKTAAPGEKITFTVTPEHQRHIKFYQPTEKLTVYLHRRSFGPSTYRMTDVTFTEMKNEESEVIGFEVTGTVPENLKKGDYRVKIYYPRWFNPSRLTAMKIAESGDKIEIVPATSDVGTSTD